MKIYLSAIVTLLIVASCKKGTSDPTNKSTSITAKCMYVSDPGNHTFVIDSFVMDENNRLAKYVRISIDSTMSTVNTYTSAYLFSYVGSDSLPMSYTTNNNDVHKLQYDRQKRIIMDSSTLIRNTFYFSYPSAGTILYQDLPPNIGHYIDTVKINNGNIVSRKYWFFNPTYTTFNNFDYSYTTSANPLCFSESIGLLLFEISGRKDYLSTNLVSQTINNSIVIQNSVWSTDQYGRVIKGEQTFSGNYKITIGYKYY